MRGVPLTVRPGSGSDRGGAALHVDLRPCLLNFVAQADQPVVQDHAKPDQEDYDHNNHEATRAGWR